MSPSQRLPSVLRILRPERLCCASQTRSFISLPSAPPSRLSERRILPFARDRVYELISDVDSYSDFLPFCQSSRVTCWRELTPDEAADHSARRLPTEAYLTIGWSGYHETFTSRLHCVAGKLVEAHSGSDVVDAPTQSKTEKVFKRLVTQWATQSIVDRGRPATEVRLTIDYQFVNPLYAAMSQAVIPTMAQVMIEAFEKRARDKLHGN